MGSKKPLELPTRYKYLSAVIKHRRFKRKMLMATNTLKYFGQNAVGYASTVFIPACSVLAAVTCFIPQFTMDQQNCQVNRVEKWNQTRKT